MLGIIDNAAAIPGEGDHTNASSALEHSDSTGLAGQPDAGYYPARKPPGLHLCHGRQRCNRVRRGRCSRADHTRK